MKVFTLKEPGGRVAPGTDVHRRALVLEADRLERLGLGLGLGGGLPALLRPATDKERRRLELDRAKYQPRLVEPRKTNRGKARDLSVIAHFLHHVVSLKEHANPKLSTERFLAWMIAELEVDASPVRKLAMTTKEFQVFLNQPRQLRWWRNRVTELRKMSR